MNTGLDIIKGWKRILNSLYIIPMVLVGCIYINYGEVFDSVLTQQNIISSFFELQTQLALFSNEFEQELLASLPKVVLNIGFYSIVLIYVLFIIWLIISTVSNYMKLSYGQGFKVLMLLEIITILTMFILFINPGLNLWLSLFVYLIIVFNVFLIVVYWLVDFKENK